MNRHGSGEFTTPTDTEILITRRFDAPADLVFDVWTTVEHVRRWWADPEHPMTVCEIDLRVGGAWRYVFGLDAATEIGFHGTFREIDRPRTIVYTETFEAEPDGETVNTMALEEHDGVTVFTLRCECGSREVRDAVLASGMEDGFQRCLDRMEDIAVGELASR